MSSNTSEIRKLISKAYKTPLNITQQKQLENVFNKDPSLILHVDLTPSKVTNCFFFCYIFHIFQFFFLFKFQFASLVELNPLIAVKMIMSYQGLDSNDLSP